jgi:hypothetical protein
MPENVWACPHIASFNPHNFVKGVLLFFPILQMRKQRQRVPGCARSQGSHWDSKPASLGPRTMLPLLSPWLIHWLLPYNASTAQNDFVTSFSEITQCLMCHFESSSKGTLFFFKIRQKAKCNSISNLSIKVEVDTLKYPNMVRCACNVNR